MPAEVDGNRGVGKSCKCRVSECVCVCRGDTCIKPHLGRNPLHTHAHARRAHIRNLRKCHYISWLWRLSVYHAKWKSIDDFIWSARAETNANSNGKLIVTHRRSRTYGSVLTLRCRRKRNARTSNTQSTVQRAINEHLLNNLFLSGSKTIW